ncbi:EpsG family protein [Riemerella anatipestifer]|uniref:EpsG family protein n=1 Tax=Weeksellaceae TaxID=2762318 RepID=UPI0023637D4E|nr:MULTISPECIES: EpsG family protein [Weeksellaceae]MDD1596978.1 EpsG family protein [Riemerella anatipestifer]MDY3328941.1 EpsG family protein [Riemerella anatipestifer]MDY3338489.1 EpsG family protein [Riemerella anatipestifer]MEC5394812.1 EpsG family protein [Bergeyella sp. RCAD1439]
MIKEIFIHIILFLVGLSIIEIFLDGLKKENHGTFLCYSAVVILIVLLTGFRPIGIDRDGLMYNEYYEGICEYTYIQIIVGSPHRIVEVGYLLINKLFCGIGFRELLLVIAVLSILPKAYLLYRYAAYPFFALLMYMSFFYLLRDFTQIRDAVAISFVLFSLFSVFYKKYLWSCFFLVLGSLFHLVSLMFIPIFLCLVYVNEQNVYYKLLLLSVPFLFWDITSEIMTILNDYLPEQLAKYNKIEGGGSGTILLLMLMTVISYFFVENDPRLEYMNKIVLIGLFTGILFYHHPVLYRITNGLAFFSILMYVNIIKKMNEHYKLLSYIFAMTIIVYFCSQNIRILIND